MAIKDIKAAGKAVYVLKDTTLYGMDIYSSSSSVSAILEDVESFDASPLGCVAKKLDGTFWYSGESITQLYGPPVVSFINLTSELELIDGYNPSNFNLIKTYSGLIAHNTITGEIYTRGLNRYGELLSGFGTYHQFFDTFTKNPEISGAYDIHPSATVTYFKIDGKLYGSGYNSGELNKVGTTTIQTHCHELPYTYTESYITANGVIFSDGGQVYYALGNTENGQLGSHYDPTRTYEIISAEEISLPVPIKVGDSNVFDQAFMYISNSGGLYGCGHIIRDIYPTIELLPYGLPYNMGEVKQITFNDRAFFLSDGEKVYYAGLVSDIRFDQLVELELPSSYVSSLYQLNSTPHAIVRTSINSDECYNPLSVSGVVKYQNSNVYFCGNTISEKSSLKVLFDGTVWFRGSRSVIGDFYGVVTEWTECTELFNAVREIRDNLLYCKFQMAVNGFYVLTPSGHIYSMGANDINDLGVGAGPSNSSQVELPKLTKTNASNAKKMGHTQTFGYYIDGRNDLYITGFGYGMGLGDTTSEVFEERGMFYHPAWTRSPLSDLPDFQPLAFKPCGMLFSSNDVLYATGYQMDYEMALASNTAAKMNPVPLALPVGIELENIYMFDANTTSPLTYFVTDQGKFYGAGMFAAGQNGDTSANTYTDFTPLYGLTLPQYVRYYSIIELNACDNALAMTANYDYAYYAGSTGSVTNGNDLALGWQQIPTEPGSI